MRVVDHECIIEFENGTLLEAEIDYGGISKDFDHRILAVRDVTKRREAEKVVSDLQARFETLTPREREIFAFVSSGLMNKQIAAELNLAEITVKIHRGHITRKMGAKSLAELVRQAEALGISRTKS